MSFSSFSAQCLQPASRDHVVSMLGQLTQHQSGYLHELGEVQNTWKNQLMTLAKESVEKTLQSVTSSLVQRQVELERKTCTRLDNLNQQLSALVQSIVSKTKASSSPFISSPLNSHCTRPPPSAPPKPPAVVSSLISQGVDGSPKATSQQYSEKPLPHSQVSSTLNSPPLNPVLEASSRTLGFSPLKPAGSPHHPPPSPDHLMTSLRQFFSGKLKIPDHITDQISVNKLFSHENSEGLYVEFTHARDVSTVFQFIHNLPNTCLVHRYIHPTLRNRYNQLSEKAYYLRNCPQRLQTKILYDKDSLKLFVKSHSEFTWYPAPDQDPHPEPELEQAHIPDSQSHQDQQPENLCTGADTPHQSGIQGHDYNPEQPPHLPHQPVSPVPQLDGIIEQTSPNNLLLPKHHNSVHPEQASYHLNQSKQAAKVAKDASRDDMEITVNNNDTNVNVKCSSGFFIVVAQPCLSSLSQGATKQYSDIQVACTEVFKLVDKGGFTDFLRLSFDLLGSDQSLIGKICVHLRHTTRLIQIQGSSKMPDKTSAAIWFTEQVLVEKFQKLAKIKKFDIGAFNQEILKMSRKHHQSVKTSKYCVECSKLFSGTPGPSPCPACQQYLHRSCLRPI